MSKQQRPGKRPNTEVTTPWEDQQAMPAKRGGRGGQSTGRVSSVTAAGRFPPTPAWVAPRQIGNMFLASGGGKPGPQQQQQQPDPAQADAGSEEYSDDIMEDQPPHGTAGPATAAQLYGSGMAPPSAPTPWPVPAAAADAVPRGLPALERVRQSAEVDTEKLLMAKDNEILRLKLQVSI